MPLRIQGTVRDRFEGFAQSYLALLDKPRRKFFREMLYGILTSGSLMLTEIGRRLEDGTSDLFYTVKRLSNNLNSEVFDRVAIEAEHLQIQGDKVKPDTLLVFDFSDASKPYGQAFEYLCTVRDGSKGTLGPGFWLLHVLAVARSGRIRPLLLRVFSQEAPDFKSEPFVLFEAVDAVFAATEGRGIFMEDRGGDNRRLLDKLLNDRRLFLIRQTGKRNVEVAPDSLKDGIEADTPVQVKTSDGTWQTRLVSDLASQMALPFKQRWHTDEGLATLFYGFAKVRLPGRAEVLTLCVADLPGHKDRLMLITNLTVRRACEAKGVIRRYFLRWDIEDAIRFGKQELAWEGFRVRSFDAIQNIELLALLALSFLSCLHRLGGRFLKGLIQKAFGLFQTPVFPYYRIIAGLQRCLEGVRLETG